jgi:lipopolysaccharide transport system permease protein
MVESEIIYLPDNAIRMGYLNLIRNMAKTFSRNPWLFWHFMVRDFNATYKQSYLGVFWAFALPAMSVGIFTLLKGAGILSVGDVEGPYILFAVTGMVFWQIFSQGIIASTSALTNAGWMITRVNFPREILVFSAVAQSLVSFLIQLIILGILFIWYRLTPPPTCVLLPVLILPLILMTLGLGFILSVLNAVFRDVGLVISYLVMFLLFITPVFYAKKVHGFLGLISDYNPLYYLISVPRSLVITGITGDLVGYGLATFISVVIFFVGWMVFHLAGVRITERV